MNIRDEDILTEIEDQSPSCPDCGISAQWIECENCDGDGIDPSYAVDPYRPNQDCPPCKGDGGEWYCECCTRKVPA